MNVINHVVLSQHGFIFVVAFVLLLYLVFRFYIQDPTGAMRRLERGINQTQCEEFIVLGMWTHIEKQLSTVQTNAIVWVKMKPILIKFLQKSKQGSGLHLTIKQIRFHLISLCSDMNHPEGIDLVESLINDIISLLKEHQLNANTRVDCHRVFERLLKQLRWVT